MHALPLPHPHPPNDHGGGGQVMLRKHGDAKKFCARVLAVGHECDIAMLTVDDEDFWSPDVEALDVEGLPDMQQEVTVVGFPQVGGGGGRGRQGMVR